MLVKRKIEDTILKYLANREIIAIVGPRQCGKTTVMKKIFADLENAVFLTFEDQDALSLFDYDIKKFINTYVSGRDYLFIDEFQYAKNGGKLLKYIYDQHDIKIIISGSSAIDLTIKEVKFLVGRVFVFEMFPFDFEEYLSFRDSNYFKLYKRERFDPADGKERDLAPAQKKTFALYYEEFLIYGGYPKVATAKSAEEKREVLKNIYNTYFLRDVKDILGLIDDYKLNNLIKSLALQIGQMIEYNELAAMSEFSVPTIKKYFNFLTKTYICDFARPFFRNKRKEIVKNKKVFFLDTGLRNQVVNDFRFLGDRPDAGSLLENIFWSEAVKRGYRPQFWRDKNKNEVDFIVEVGAEKSVAIEIKRKMEKMQNLPLSFTNDYPDFLPFGAYLEGDKQGSEIKKIFLPLF